MKVVTLKKGMKCSEVGDWQSFLRGESIYFGVIDEDFGDKTHEATISFQKKYGLTADGIVGESTYAKATLLGFHTEKIIVSATNNDNVPPKPNFQPITGNATREKLFGKFSYRPAPSSSNPEGIIITDDWESKNIVRVNLPALSKATNGQFSSMRFHKECEHQLVKMFEQFEKEKLHTRILSYAGAFYPRFIRGSKTQLSNHSWGTAFDINVRQKGLGKKPAMIGEKGCVRELVPIAHEFGFYWGGHFTRKDGMHFEIAKIL